MRTSVERPGMSLRHPLFDTRSDLGPARSCCSVFLVLLRSFRKNRELTCLVVVFRLLASSLRFVALHGFSDLLSPMNVFAPVLNANAASGADNHDRFELGLTAFANHGDATSLPWLYRIV